MYIVEVQEPRQPTYYVSNFGHAGYATISDLNCSPVREHAYVFADQAQAEEALAAAQRLYRRSASQIVAVAATTAGHHMRRGA